MDEMDKLLDSALRAYGEQEAPLGMEGRVLRRVLATQPRRRWWLALVPVTGMLGLIAFWWGVDRPLPHGRSSEVVVKKGAVVNEKPVVNERPAISPRPAEARARARRSTTRMPLVAPPEEPTAQQIALLRFARSYPEQAVEATRAPASDITIEPLKIEPLQVTELGDNLR